MHAADIDLGDGHPRLHQLHQPLGRIDQQQYPFPLQHAAAQLLNRLLQGEHGGGDVVGHRGHIDRLLPIRIGHFIAAEHDPLRVKHMTPPYHHLSMNQPVINSHLH